MIFLLLKGSTANGRARRTVFSKERLIIQQVVVLIDGEHYLPVIKDAIESLKKDHEYKVLAAVFIGGTEKILLEKNLESLGLPIIAEANPLNGIRKALADYSPEWVIDLSDEPVAGYNERFQFASHILSCGVSYAGADFEFRAPIFHNVAKKPSVSIIGTGKRVGKTAISAYFARKLQQAGFFPVTVAMGRGGPEKPEIIDREKALTPEFMLQVSEKGMHAASDAYEDALMSRISTVACRRCGGGMAGAPFVSNVLSGAVIANKLEEHFVIFEGSGAALPPVKTDACLLTIGAHQPLEYIDGYFGTYRIILSDLVVLTMCEEPLSDAAQINAILEAVHKIKPGIEVFKTIFRPYPLKSIENRKVLFVTTGPALMNDVIKEYLESKFACEVTDISNNLANRRLLLEDLRSAAGRFDLLLTELKAASVDVVTKTGLNSGAEIVYCDNVPIVVDGDSNLSRAMLDLAKNAKEHFERAQKAEEDKNSV